MTIHFYSIMVGFGLAILTVVGCLAMLLGWFFYLGAKLRHSRNVDKRVHDVRLTRLAAWGQPDLMGFVGPGCARLGAGSGQRVSTLLTGALSPRIR